MSAVRSVRDTFASACSWRWWVLCYRVESVRQALRSFTKRAIMAGINAACTFGEWLIRVLKLGDA